MVKRRLSHIRSNNMMFIRKYQTDPKGTVKMFYGIAANIPVGWQICDGTNGTPDLRNRFPAGADRDNGTEPQTVIDVLVRTNGGHDTHYHDFVTDGHSHSITAGIGIAYGSSLWNYTNDATDSGSTMDESTIPPYRALYFIMKL